MGIDCTKMERIWKNDPMERSHVHVQGVGIRATDGNHMLTLCQQIIPALKYFRDGVMPDELREDCIEGTMDFGWDNRFEFAQSVPQFNARVAMYLPGFPGDVRLIESWSFRVARVGDKR
jgi:hypothetical protein